MSRSVLLLLSILILQGSGCEDFLRGVVKNLQTTINSDHAGFRKVFPKDYLISHHYNDNLLCNTGPCCVFGAATVLSDSWLQLRSQLWPEHQSFKFISNLIQVLDDRGMTKGRFEDPDPSVLPSVSSSPEKLLNFTSSVFSKWLELRCSTPGDTCSFPTLASPAGEEERAALASPAGEEERAALESKKVRLLTTRAVHMQDRGNEGETGMRLHIPPPTNRSPPANGGLLLALSGCFFFFFYLYLTRQVS
uniref:Zgc:174888 n=1 Tax=Hucho hucho TaxID=62062 RepID=A0A4W5QXN4_9TELE